MPENVNLDRRLRIQGGDATLWPNGPGQGERYLPGAHQGQGSQRPRPDDQGASGGNQGARGIMHDRLL